MLNCHVEWVTSQTKLWVNSQIVFVKNKIMNSGLLWMFNSNYIMKGMQNVMTMNVHETKEQAMR